MFSRLMWCWKNVIIVGTSHVEVDVYARLRRYFVKFRPKVVALELDNARYHGLYLKSRRSLSWGGVLGWVQDAIGKGMGVQPGDDMRAADRLAKNFQAKVVCIDRPLSVTLSRLKSSLSFREKWLLCKDIISVFFVRSKVVMPKEADIFSMIELLRVRFPSMYRVLVTERDEVLGKNLYNLSKSTKGKVIAVVGAGHIPGMKKVMKCLQKKS